MKKQITMMDIFETWDNGEFFFNEIEQELMALPEGEKVGDILKNATKCPVRNATCETLIVMKLRGVHPNKGHKDVDIYICPLGVSGNGVSCPLNK